MPKRMAHALRLIGALYNLHAHDSSCSLQLQLHAAAALPPALVS